MVQANAGQDHPAPLEELPGNPFEHNANLVNVKSLLEEQRADSTLDRVREYARKEEHRYYINDHGVMCRQFLNEFGRPLEIIVVPKVFRAKVFQAAHKNLLAGHLCDKKTLDKIYTHFTWPTVAADVSRWCRQCKYCQRYNQPQNNQAPLSPLPVVEEPWHTVAFDIVGPLTRTGRNNKYLVTCIDLSTRYPEAVPVKAVDVPSLVEPLMSIFTQHGMPKVILTDQGSNFTSRLFREICDRLSIAHITATAYRPQTNGALERFHRSLKLCLDKHSNSDKDWDILVKYILFALREAPNTSTGYPPFSLLYGRQVRGPLAILAESWNDNNPLPASIREHIQTLRENLEVAWAVSQQHDAEAKDKRKEVFDQTAKAKPFEVGDNVLVRVPRPGKMGKVEWLGPYVVLDKPSEVTYTLNLPTRNRSKKVVHRNALKAYKAEINRCIVAMGSDDDGTLPIPTSPKPDSGPSSFNLNTGEITDEQRSRLQTVIGNFPEVMKDTPSKDATVEPIKINLKDDTPISVHPYQIPDKKKEAVKQEIDNLLRDGIIRPSTSPWNFPAVVVPKPDGSVRICVNYQKLNSQTVPDPFPLPRMEAITNEASKAKWITTLDLAKGFHQVPVHQDSVAKTSFLTDFGKYEYVRMPFGIMNGPSHFQRCLSGILGNTPRTSAYIDDIVIFSNNFEQHLEDIEAVMTLLSEYNLTAKPAKAKFCMDSVTFLGHHIGQGKIRPTQVKVEAFQQFPQPSTKKKLRTFLGATNFYRRFIKHYATIASPLYPYLKKDSPDKFTLSRQAEAAFEKLKAAITSVDFLVSPDPDRQYQLATDASTTGVGAVLSQKDDEGRERPVAYFSRKLLQYQRNYSATELELLALVLSVQHFAPYLLGATFTVTTDHKALLQWRKLKTANGRLARWALILQPYDFTIEYRKGEENGNADALSRAFEDPHPVLQEE